MSKSDQQKTVLTFLVQQNRPMSANDILAGFTGQLTKTSITNALDTLVSDQKISEKTYGKQKVYMALQVSRLWKQNRLLFN
jgi:26S proteasome regulatory subunit (ATPase 3-interacting protein)